jgi:FOG: EAL domain
LILQHCIFRILILLWIANTFYLAETKNVSMTIELTETEQPHPAPAVIESIKVLQNLDVRFSLGDFSAEYSNFI